MRNSSRRLWSNLDATSVRVRVLVHVVPCLDDVPCQVEFRGRGEEEGWGMPQRGNCGWDGSAQCCEGAE